MRNSRSTCQRPHEKYMQEGSDFSKCYFVKFPDNTTNNRRITCWGGFGSSVDTSGPVVQYICEYLFGLPQKTMFISYTSDGHYPILDEVKTTAKDQGATLIASVLAGVEQLPHFFYCVASDEFFVKDVYEYFVPYHVPWHQKEDVLFWRGGLSGGDWRVNTVKKCLTIPKTDVKFVDGWTRTDCNPTITPEMFAERVDHFQQLRYKALLYIDGNSSASNTTWIFASGSVPVLVNKYEFWFRKFLVPWVHYVPVKWDLSDLEEQIAWIWNHEEEARQIAENALEFSRTILSCENQRTYLRDEIDHLLRDKTA